MPKSISNRMRLRLLSSGILGAQPLPSVLLFLLFVLIPVYAGQDPVQDKLDKIKGKKSVKKSPAPRPPAIASHPKVEAKPTNETPPQPKDVKEPKVDLPQTGALLLTVDSSFSDIHILLDGESIDANKLKKIASNTEDSPDTTFELENIAAGRHKLRFIHPTINNLEQEIDIKVGKPYYLKPVFERIKGILIIKSEPGAEIFIDGQSEARVLENGMTEVLYITPGKHSIKAVKNGYSPAERTEDFDLNEREMELKLLPISK